MELKGLWLFSLTFLIVVWLIVFGLEIDWLELDIELMTWLEIGNNFFSPTEVGIWQICLPSLLSIIAAMLLQYFSPQPGFWSRLIAAIIAITLVTQYIIWRLLGTLYLANVWIGCLSVLFFLAELLNYISTISFYAQTVQVRDRSQAADHFSQAIINGTYQPSIDILIPTYNESIDILTRTVIGCQSINYPQKKIYLLDDGCRPEIEKLSKYLGCFYIERVDRSHAKAGNLNHALKLTSGELITIFDADFVPAHNFLERTAGFFQNPQVALVQTPQNFYNTSSFLVNLKVDHLISNDVDLSFQYMEAGRDALDSPLCSGTSFIIRRSALGEIGGIPTQSITEDFYTSMKLISLGYKVIYLNEVISAGAAPENISAYINQKLRWAQGNLQLLFCPENPPLFNPGLNLTQRLVHFSAIIFWCTAITRLFYLLLPAFSLIFDIYAINPTIPGILMFFLPYYIFNLCIFNWLNGGLRSIIWSDVFDILMCFPVTIAVCRTLISPFKGRFKVTPKGVVLSKITINLQLGIPLILTAIAYFIGGFRHLGGIADPSDEIASLVITLIWSFYNLALLSVCIQATIEIPQERRFLRFPHNLNCQLDLATETVPVKTINLSEGGALIQVPESIQLSQLPKTAKLYIPDLTDTGTMVRIVRNFQQDEQVYLGLEFIGLSLLQTRNLVKYIFCFPYQWQPARTTELKAAAAFLQTVFRFYPLAEARGQLVDIPPRSQV
ncbi:glycosyltransferase family 2 protein [Nodularia sp. UHCC 0506]|uniref:glycosyltransferase family 2 protein n=1 Tax=Nodularia sp. UHCC 0506 TaxID=3110243 RepID=UPI002B219B45|nr:glycosyltransferase family 2 protein [Nodularia sp. UHCC 0506]MEA5514416.1 glycosyltransferase family 2 protein [Nodularia sp. UHCC 0506]